MRTTFPTLRSARIRRSGAALAALLVTSPVLAGDCESVTTENFVPPSGGTPIGAAVLVDVGGFPRLKLVSDFQPGSWGTWVLPSDASITGTIASFQASFRLSFKNDGNGGPGDGFSFLFGDLSDLEGNRAEGGEWGFNAFGIDGDGLTVGFAGYPNAGGNGINVKRGGASVAFVPFDFSPVTYSDYVQAGNPLSMPTVTIDWSRAAGVTVRIALPFQDPVTILESAGAKPLSSMSGEGWAFGFAGRNGAIDMDVLLGDLSIAVTYDCSILAGDFDGNGAVDGADLAVLLSGWGVCPGKGGCPADLDGDGAVGGSDLAIVLGNWSAG